MMDGTAYAPTLFLDTNALHNMNTYLRNAKRHGLPPFGGTVLTHQQVKVALQQFLPPKLSKFQLHGCETIAYLQRQVATNPRIELFTSRIAKAELIHGVLDGQAHARMALAGIPYRKRQNMQDLGPLVRMYLEPSDYVDLRLEVDDLLETLEERVGITVDYAEDNQQLPAVSHFAEFLQGRVFLDVPDCWIYAAALVVRADRIVTFDEGFSRVINRLFEPNRENDPDERAYWQQLRDEMRQEWHRLSPVETAVAFAFPDHQVPGPGVPDLWGVADA